jgi:hypothetical protein
VRHPKRRIDARTDLSFAAKQGFVHVSMVSRRWCMQMVHVRAMEFLVKSAGVALIERSIYIAIDDAAQSRKWASIRGDNC